MRYVLGFLFTEAREAVLLYRKPVGTMHEGLLNGVGGRIENGERPHKAMEREMYEETGLGVVASAWRLFAWLHWPNGHEMFVFRATATPYDRNAKLPDACKWMSRSDVLGLHPVSAEDFLAPHVMWLIQMACEHHDINDTPAEIFFK